MFELYIDAVYRNCFIADDRRTQGQTDGRRPQLYKPPTFGLGPKYCPHFTLSWFHLSNKNASYLRSCSRSRFLSLLPALLSSSWWAPQHVSNATRQSENTSFSYISENKPKFELKIPQYPKTMPRHIKLAFRQALTGFRQNVQ